MTRYLLRWIFLYLFVPIESWMRRRQPLSSLADWWLRIGMLLFCIAWIAAGIFLLVGGFF